MNELTRLKSGSRATTTPQLDSRVLNHRCTENNTAESRMRTLLTARQSFDVMNFESYCAVSSRVAV